MIFLYTVHVTWSHGGLQVFYWVAVRTSTCKGAPGCRYQSIFDLAHPPSPSMKWANQAAVYNFVFLRLHCIPSQAKIHVGYEVTEPGQVTITSKIDEPLYGYPRSSFSSRFFPNLRCFDCNGLNVYSVLFTVGKYFTTLANCINSLLKSTKSNTYSYWNNNGLLDS